MYFTYLPPEHRRRHLQPGVPHTLTDVVYSGPQHHPTARYWYRYLRERGIRRDAARMLIYDVASHALLYGRLADHDVHTL
jgi:hypothetical protein